MAEFSLKDTLIGGGILFGIGVFIKKVKGKKQVEDDSQDWGGDPDGQLAKALAKVREESKKPREPLKLNLGALWVLLFASSLFVFLWFIFGT